MRVAASLCESVGDCRASVSDARTGEGVSQKRPTKMKNPELPILKYFAMDLEWLLRAKPEWREIAQGVLFQKGDIVKHSEKAEEDAQLVFPVAASAYFVKYVCSRFAVRSVGDCRASVSDARTGEGVSTKRPTR